MKVIELNESVTASNDADAAQLRQEMKEQKTLLVNVMSSPGSGKTTLLSRTIQDLKKSTDLRMAVIEADIASDVDAVTMEKLGVQSLQAHTDGMCHMDAGMTRRALEALGDGTRSTGAENSGHTDLIFLENVGNLICPAEFDTGAGTSVMLLSVPEGDDKPLKYPLMFAQSDVLVITKVDVASYFDFDFQACEERVKRLNPDIRIFPVSAATGEGMEAWEVWLREAVADWKN